MDYIIHLLILIAIFGINTLALNLLVGYTGLLSLAPATFGGIGAYAVAILTTKMGTPFLLAVVLGVVIAVVVAIIVGWILSRLSGDYYLLGTVSFGFVVWSIVLNWTELTRGSLGIPSVPRPEFFGIALTSNLSFLGLALGCFALAYWFCRYITRTSFGRVLQTIREDEGAIQVFGYNTTIYKIAVFAISAGLAAVVGGLYASYNRYFDPSSLLLMESVFVLTRVILGGPASLLGSILGTVFLVTVPELLRFVGLPVLIAGQMRQAIYGLVLILLVLYRPQGLIGKYKL